MVLESYVDGCDSSVCGSLEVRFLGVGSTFDSNCWMEGERGVRHMHVIIAWRVGFPPGCGAQRCERGPQRGWTEDMSHVVAAVVILAGRLN